MFHGHNSENGSWDSNSRNPRVPNRLSLENIQYANLSPDRVSELDNNLHEILAVQSNVAKSEEEVSVQIHQAETYSWLAYLTSSYGSGIVDELSAFVKMGVLAVNSSGIPSLVEDWQNQVDIVVLSDMDGAWNKSEDPDGLYCVNEKLRAELADHWVKSDHGWALVEEPDEIIFDFEELEEWRRSFEGKVETQANHAEGIGRFGL